MAASPEQPLQQEPAMSDRIKVWSDLIACYLIVLVIIAVGVSLLPFAAEVKLILFALAALAWAIRFPRWKQRLPSERVDFWYYTLGIIGTLLFFLANDLQRQKLELQDLYGDQIAEREFAEYRNELMLELEAPEQRDAVYRQIVSVARKHVTTLRGQGILNSEDLCVTVEIMPLRPALRDDRWHDDGQGLRGRSERYRLNDPSMMCDPYVQEDIRKRHVLALQWEEVASAPDVISAIQIIDQYSLIGSINVDVDGRILNLSVIDEFLMLTPGSADWDDKRAAIDAEIETAKADIDATSRQYAALGKDIGDTLSIKSFAALAAFVWPYILIAALSMKLARKRYRF